MGRHEWRLKIAEKEEKEVSRAIERKEETASKSVVCISFFFFFVRCFSVEFSLIQGEGVQLHSVCIKASGEY